MNSARLLKAIWAFAGSRAFSVFVLVTSVTYALVLATFGVLVDTRWLDIMAGLYPFKLLYALFFLNLVLFGIGWVPGVVRRCRRAEPAHKTELPDKFEHARQIPGAGFRGEDLKQYLRRRGYRILDDAATDVPPGQASVFHASRGRYSPLGNLLFHAGFLLLLVGAVTNAFYRFEGTAFITEGGSFTGAKQEYRTIASPSTAALPKVDFDVEKISAEFWRGRVLFTRLEAQIMDRGGLDVAKLSSAARVGNAEVTISGYAYAPTYRLKNRKGEFVSMGRVRLNIFGPGSEDYFYVPGYPYKIFVSFYPDYAKVDGKIVNGSIEPLNPAYFLRIMRGRIPVYTGLVRPGAWAEFDGMSISFPSFVKTGSFQIVRNPGNPFIWTAFAAMVLGLAWRLLLYRKEVVLWRDDASRTWLSGSADYYRKLHAGWIDSLAERFGRAST